MNKNNDSSKFLRRSLMGNAIFSGISAMTFLMFHQAIAGFIGPVPPMIILGIGLCLLVFAFGLFRNAMRNDPNLMEAMIAITMDLAWVIGSVAVLGFNLLSRQGNWAVGMIADVVLVFAILQWVGLRRMQKAQDPVVVGS